MTKTAYETGILSEKLARAFLRLKGYRVLSERFRTPVGEIDLVLEKGRMIVFVEVKARRTLSDALEAVHAKNQERVRNAALLYLQQHPEYTDHALRFDVLALAQNHLPHHIKNAF